MRKVISYSSAFLCHGDGIKLGVTDKFIMINLKLALTNHPRECTLKKTK